jgi:hypothetical protein
MYWKKKTVSKRLRRKIWTPNPRRRLYHFSQGLYRKGTTCSSVSVMIEEMDGTIIRGSPIVKSPLIDAGRYKNESE